MSRHPVQVRKEATVWTAECDNGHMVFMSFAEAIDYADQHANYGDDESRWCESCHRYQPTCNDYCLNCGSST